MKVGILGTGEVGQALGSGLVANGHDVLMGSRKAGNEKAATFVKRAGPKAKAGTFADAAKFGDVIVLATKWTGTKDAIDLAGGAKAFAGKVVLDVTNPLDTSKGDYRLTLVGEDSGGEQVQRWLKGAKVVKVFNIVGAAEMVNPRFPDGLPDMFICGNDKGAKKTAGEICRQFGWPPVIDLGGIEQARAIEPLCILWVQYGLVTDTWNHAFKLLRK
ncbi:MAG: NADPH-dependent F420 reductase [Gemmatimonadales bacterium]